MDSTPLKELGCPYPDNVLLLVEGGSKLHGAKLEGTDDTEWYGLDEPRGTTGSHFSKQNPKMDSKMRLRKEYGQYG